MKSPHGLRYLEIFHAEHRIEADPWENRGRLRAFSGEMRTQNLETDKYPPNHGDADFTKQTREA